MKAGIILDTAIGSMGIKRYSLKLVEGLAQKVDKLKVFYSLDSEELNKIHNIELHKLKQPFNDPFLGIGYRQMFQLPKILPKEDLDLIQDTYNFGPFVWPIKNKKSIVVVHDIAPYIYNYRLFYDNPALTRAYTKFRYEFIFPRILKNVDHILTISNNTKKDLIEQFNVSPSKIDVVYHGIDHHIFKEYSEDEVDKIKNKYDIGEDSIIIGSLNSERRIDNVNELLESFSILNKLYPQIKLLLIGKSNENVDNLIESLKLEDSIIKTGYAPDFELPLLYNAMDILLFLSDYEGFGFPPLEAMACGTPVVVLNRSSMPEIVGNAGIFLDKKEPQYIAQKIKDLIEDTQLKNKLKKKGIKRSKNFNWDNTIESTFKAYEKLI